MRELFDFVLILSAAILFAGAIACLAGRAPRAVAVPVLVVLLLPAPLMLLIEVLKPHIAAVTGAAWTTVVLASWIRSRGAANLREARRRFGWIALALLAFDALVLIPPAYIEWSRDRAASKARREENARRLNQSEAWARACVRALGARDPEADAAADAGRGDATPIGVTIIPDEGDWGVSYPEACEGNDKYRPYQSTGKWFGRIRHGWDEYPPPPSAFECDRRVHLYIQRYNRHMVAIAPAAVGRFCEREGGTLRSSGPREVRRLHYLSLPAPGGMGGASKRSLNRARA